MNNHSYNEKWNDSLTGNYLWNNTNFGEAITETMTPATWSVLQFTLDDWIFVPGFSTVGNIGGFPYINISIFATLFQAFGKNQKEILEMMEGTMYMQLPEGMEIPKIPLSRKETIAGLLNLIRVQLKQGRASKRLAAYLEHNPIWFKEMRTRIQKEQVKAELVNLWYSEIRPHIKQGVWTVLGTAYASTDYTSRLKRELAALIGAEDTNALLSNISTEVGLLPSLGPSVGLANVANGKITQEAHIERYGHRGPHEFELSKPRPVENPNWLNNHLEYYQTSPLEVETLLIKQQESFDAAWQRFSASYPQKTKTILNRLKENSQRALLREEARSEYVRDRWLIRIFIQRAGELTGFGDDIFFLTLDETLSLLSGKAIANELIGSRRELYNKYKSLPAYPSVIRGHFDPFIWAADPNRRDDIYDEGITYSILPRKLIKGAAGSAGCIKGSVRIMKSPEENGQFQDGEILVTRMTDISWTPIFPRASAVVTDIGAPLSHAAIVARELGIPAVVGCQDATTHLKTGDVVKVDGNAGEVTILSED